MIEVKEVKKCVKCGEEKVTSLFPRDKNCKDGLSSWCKSCHSIASQKSKKKSIKTPKGMAKHLINHANARAKANGGICDIDVDWLENILIVGECQATRIPFDLTRDEWTDSVTNPYVPSLDRIDSNNPNYTIDNVQVVIWGYNRAKSDLPNDDLLIEIGQGIQRVRINKSRTCKHTASFWEEVDGTPTAD